MGDPNVGLIHKFNVERTDGTSKPGQKHDGCDYWVLDLTHDPFALPALIAYERACRASYPVLADDLRDKIRYMWEKRTRGVSRDRGGVMQTHELKVWPEYFAALASGRKNFEVRRDDRGFSEGDTLRLREWRPDMQLYTGAELLAGVVYLLRGPVFGIEDGFVVMQLGMPQEEPYVDCRATEEG